MGPALDGGPLRYSVSLTQNPPRGLTGPKLRPSNSWWCLQIVLTFGDRPQPDCVASRHGRVMARQLGGLAPRHLLGVSPPPIYNPPSIEGQVAQLVEQRTENPRVGSSILPLATCRTSSYRSAHPVVDPHCPPSVPRRRRTSA